MEHKDNQPQPPMPAKPPWYRRKYVRSLLCFLGGGIVALLILFIISQEGFADLRLRQFAQTGSALEVVLTTSQGGEISPEAIRSGIERLGVSLARGVPQGYVLHVAVADFTNVRGVPTDEGRFIADRLTTILAQNPQLVVVERQQLSDVLYERNLVIRDLANEQTAQEVGRALGVRAFVFGTVSMVSDGVEVNARLVDVDTGEIVAGALASLRRDEEKLVGEERQKVIITPESTLLDFRFPQVIHDSDLAFELQFCEVREIVIVCRVTAWNTGDDQRTISVDIKKSYLVGETGRQYVLKQVEPFSDDPPASRWGGWDLPPGTRRALDLTFGIQGLPEDKEIAAIVAGFRSYPNARGFPDVPHIVFQRS